MKDFRYLPDATTLSLNTDACTGCAMCTRVCPHGVFAVQDKKARIVDRDGCMECGACALNCPEKAIGVTPGVGVCGLYHPDLAERNEAFLLHSEMLLKSINFILAPENTQHCHLFECVDMPSRTWNKLIDNQTRVNTCRFRLGAILFHNESKSSFVPKVGQLTRRIPPFLRTRETFSKHFRYWGII